MSDYNKKLITGEAYVALGNKVKEYTDEKFNSAVASLEEQIGAKIEESQLAKNNGSVALLTIPKADMDTMLEDGESELIFSKITYDENRTYYIEYDGKVYPSTSVSKNYIEFNYYGDDGFYVELDNSYSSSTVMCFYYFKYYLGYVEPEDYEDEPPMPTTATDMVIKYDDIKYLDNNLLDENLQVKNSLSVGVRNGEIGGGSTVTGAGNQASGTNSFAQGEGNKATGLSSSAMGSYTTAEAPYAHAEGYKTSAFGTASHVEGTGEFTPESLGITKSSTIEDILSTWENSKFSLAKGTASHVEGESTLALNGHAHAEGYWTIAEGSSSHAEGENTIASGYAQHVQGKWNIEDVDTYAHIVGNGDWNEDTKQYERSNAHTLDWDGNAWFAGQVIGTNLPYIDGVETSVIFSDNEITQGSKTSEIIQFGYLPFSDNKCSHKFQVGKQFKIKINDNEYVTCECKEYIPDNDIIPQHYYLGNYSLVASYWRDYVSINGQQIPAPDLGDTGETFCILISIPDGRVNIAIPSITDAFSLEIAAEVDNYVQLDRNFIQEVPGKIMEAYSLVKYPTFDEDSGELVEVEVQIGDGAEIFNEYNLNIAVGDHSHAEGFSTKALGGKSHAEGADTIASGEWSHAEGGKTEASGDCSHAEGNNTVASGESSHAEGSWNTASGWCSHAEGTSSTASGDCSHVEGYENIATGEYQHVQGKWNIEDANDTYAHIVGNGEYENRSNAHTLDWDGNAWYAGNVTVGADNKVLATEEHVDALANIALVKSEQALTTAEKDQVRSNLGYIGRVAVVGEKVTVDGKEYTVEQDAEIFGDYANNIAIGSWSIAEGSENIAVGKATHVEGAMNKGLGVGCHVEGVQCTASGYWSHAEGERTIVTSYASHAEGSYTNLPDGTVSYGTASGYASHIEGGGCHATGSCSHAQGLGTRANGYYSNATGAFTVASGQAQTTEGRCNIEDTANKYIHIAGNGTWDNGQAAPTRSNAYTLDWNGNAWFAGDVKIGADNKVLATQDYVDNIAGNIIIDEDELDAAIADILN